MCCAGHVRRSGVWRCVRRCERIAVRTCTMLINEQCNMLIDFNDNQSGTTWTRTDVIAGQSDAPGMRCCNSWLVLPYLTYPALADRQGGGTFGTFMAIGTAIRCWYLANTCHATFMHYIIHYWSNLIELPCQIFNYQFSFGTINVLFSIQFSIDC